MHREFKHETKTYKVISEWMDDTLKVFIHPEESDAQVLYSIETTREKLAEMRRRLEVAEHLAEGKFVEHAIEDFKSRRH